MVGLNIYLPIEPTHVFKILIRFIGVYMDVYNIKFAAPKAAVKGFAP